MAGKGRMRVSIDGDRDTVVMRLQGNLDGSSACEVEQALDRVVDKTTGRKLVFDLGGVRTYEYFGVAILAKTIRNQRNHFQEVLLKGLSAATENVFKHFGVYGAAATSA
ncbi:MAG TPA: STAS domain-containing protein [Syntrophobacteria bacterium]|nr:STAS domain-containing protein [Syntrophobacteria bacterium]